MDITSKTIRDLDESAELEHMRRLESILFVSGRFLTMQDLITFSDLNPLIIKELIGKLKEKHNKDDSALEIIERENMWKMDVKPEYSYIINRLATGSAEFTKAEQETLAIIAYKQPIKQSVIVKIRGNKAYDHVKKFADLNLIRKKKSGHTNILNLSEEFYDYFNVEVGENPFGGIKEDNSS